MPTSRLLAETAAEFFGTLIILLFGGGVVAAVVLFGTGDTDHLRQNIASILRPPLPEADRSRLARLFGHLRGVGLALPPPMPGRG